MIMTALQAIAMASFILGSACKLKPEVINTRTGGNRAGAEQQLESPPGRVTPTPTPSTTPALFSKSGPAQLALGDSHSCLFLPPDKLRCVGNSANRLMEIPATNQLQLLAAGRAHNCGLDNSGVFCWGENNWQQSQPPAISNAQRLVLGSTHSCAIVAPTTLQCWGHTLPAGLNKATFTALQDVAVGIANICVIDGGKVSCFGDDNYGVISSAPAVSNATSLHMYAHHACMIDSAQNLSCWGNNEDGQTTLPQNIKKAMQVVTGLAHSCTLATDKRTVRCWGTTASQLNAPPTATDDILSIASGARHSCFVTETNKVQCWGANDFGQATF